MKGRLLSNVTIQPLAQYLSPIPVTVGDYDSMFFELVDEKSVAAEPEVTHVICAYDSEALLSDVSAADGSTEKARQLIALLDRFCARNPKKIIVANTFYFSSVRVANFMDVVSETGLRALETELNGALIDVARRNENLVLVDLESIFRRYGEERMLTTAFWYSARVRYTGLMFQVLGERIRGALDAYGNRSRKLLIVDLDNTLWGGIVGELGPSGIGLSTDGVGACYRDFQRALKALKQLGVVLAVCSKNNPEDVDEVFARNAMMILSREDFVSIKANWSHKPQNILETVQALNIGLDSAVFIDDNAVERSIVSQALPEVAVPEFPARPEALPSWFLEVVVPQYFPRYRITKEDAEKTRQYQANQRRQQMSSTFGIDEFIRELDIKCTIRVDDPETVQRASQMTQKTNQFNLTTWRCEVPEVQEYVSRTDRSLVVMEYEDRFGSEGIVALAMLDLANGYITNFLMSCRVIGRRVESQLLSAVLDIFRKQQIKHVLADYVRTKKNEQTSTFYESSGFSLIHENDERKSYKMELPA